ncbi:glycosyl hydrolase 53 family protein [Pseudomaricurvus sp.]|uniref:glycosyl hydrolase 53 family protein n=1 Tax=Pseudomaricurvus sp. TaxID=2004510 RepID=UPI003F6D23E7
MYSFYVLALHYSDQQKIDSAIIPQAWEQKQTQATTSQKHKYLQKKFTVLANTLIFPTMLQVGNNSFYTKRYNVIYAWPISREYCYLPTV